MYDGIAGVAQVVRQRIEPIARPAEAFVRMVAFAISQSDKVDVNEIRLRAMRQTS